MAIICFRPTSCPYIGRHYQIDDTASFNDCLLDVLFFAELSKMEL